jgi:hypothetical protein
MRRVVITTMVLLAAGLGIRAAVPQSEETGKEQLERMNRPIFAGLTGVGVLVEDVNSKAKEDGLDKTTLQTDVELRLREAGVPVLLKSEALKRPGCPILYLSVIVLERESGGYAYSADVELTEQVTLVRKPAVIAIGATTWHARSIVGVVGASELAETVRGTVRDQVAQFVNVYLAANPKRAGRR